MKERKENLVKKFKSREYKEIKIDELVKYSNNSRTHSDEQIDEIKNSIKEFGFTNPILIDEKNTIIAGHARLEAAKELGMKEVPTILVDGLNNEQRAALVIADNKLALNAGWDFDILKIELSFLKDEGFDLALTGFHQDELDVMFAPELQEGLCDEDEVPEAPDEPITKLGDIIILGNHRLMCGDSTMIDSVEKLMNGEKVDMVFTDPPYGVKYQSNMRTKSSQFEVLANDDGILDIAAVVYSFLKDNSAAFIWTSHAVYPQWRKQFSENYKNTIIWYKAAGGMGDLAGNYATDYEMAIFCVKGKVNFKNGRGMAVWKIEKDPNVEYQHPTQKPVALAQKAIEDLTTNKNIILDIFGGSGSTLIACEKTNRKCYMMELSPKYCDVIVARWEKFAGKRAIYEKV